MAWIYLNLNPAEIRTGDCVVRALAYALDQTWDHTYLTLSEKGYEMCQMPSWNSTWMAYLKDHGFRRYIIEDTCPDCYSVNDFCIDHPVGKYVLYIPHSSEQAGHVTIVENGNVYDTWDCTQETPLVYWRKE